MNMIDKIKKLLVQAKNHATTPEEAASFAARAQELMQKFKVEEVDLSLSQGTQRVAEKVEQAVLEDTGKAKATPWRIQLASNLATAFNSRVYYTMGTGQTKIVGRPSDASAVRYLHSYLCLEVERLAHEGYERLKSAAGPDMNLPRPSLWKNSFRDGMVATIGRRLRERRDAEKARFQGSGPSVPPIEEESSGEVAPAIPLQPSTTALVLVVQDDKQAAKEVEEKYKQIMGPRGGRKSNWGGRGDSGGYREGAKAGEGVTLGGGRELPKPANRIGD